MRQPDADGYSRTPRPIIQAIIQVHCRRRLFIRMSESSGGDRCLIDTTIDLHAVTCPSMCMHTFMQKSQHIAVDLIIPSNNACNACPSTVRLSTSTTMVSRLLTPTWQRRLVSGMAFGTIALTVDDFVGSIM